MMRIKKYALRPLLLCLLFCLLLTGCGGKAESAAMPTASPTEAPTPTPAPTPKPTPTPTPEVRLHGSTYLVTAPEVTLTGLTEAELADTAAALRRMTGLESIRLGDEGQTPLSWDSLCALHDAAPAAVMDYGFTLFDRAFNLSDEEMDLKYIQMQDEGELVGKVAHCMTRLRLLDMDSCGVSNEAMARLRDSLPETEVVWRINFGAYYTARTNVTRILASMPGQAGELVHRNVENLKYCSKVKYLDLGHNNYLDTIEFIRGMPDLEVLIVGMTFVEDFTPVAACPKLEYVEAMTSRLHDLTPFAELQNLHHLNICFNFAITDITPLYGLQNLERLWIGMHDPVPPEQIARFRELHPNCVVNDTTPDPTEEYWRFADHGDAMGNPMYDPRYALLREQFDYEGQAYAFYWLDPLYPYFSGYDRGVTPDPEVVDFADLYLVY